MVDSKEIEISGRRFKAVTVSTVEHDHWVMRYAEAAGLLNLTLQPGENLVAFAQRIHRQAVLSDNIWQLLGGLILPVEMDSLDWTPATAAETATFLRKLVSEPDKATVNGLTASMLAGFLQRGIASISTSDLSSALGSVDGSRGLAQRIEELSTMVSGIPSSASSQVTTRPDTSE